MTRKPDLGPGGRPFQHSGDCLAAEQRIAIAAAPPGTAEAAKKTWPIDAVNAYRPKQDCPPTESIKDSIKSIEQYEQAKRRVEELCRYGQNTAQADEQDRLMSDIQAWDDGNPRATPRRRQSEPRH
jgi:hypothetical protein